MTINYLKNHDIDFKIKVGRKDLTPSENAIRLMHDKAATLVITSKKGSDWLNAKRIVKTMCFFVVKNTIKNDKK